MKKLSLGLLAVSTIFTFACLAPAGGDDAGTSRRDAGSTDTASGHDSGGGGVDAGGGTWSASNYGQPCSSDAQCPGGACVDVFGGGGASACFKSCSSAADCSDFPYNASAVQCAPLSSGGPSVCVMGSGQNGPCGNPLNATCMDQEYSLCGTDADGYGSCVRVCNPNDPSNATGCRVAGLPDGVCGCTGTDECSASLLGFSSGVEGDPDGICAPPLSAGATCGFDPSTLEVQPCTGGLECQDITQGSGTCGTPVVDGGVVDDAAVAEDI